MATQNIRITEQGWQDLATLGSITFTQDQEYTITVRGASVCEVVLASTKPDETFLGHIAKADENFNFTYTGDKVWIKCRVPVTVVLS